MGFSLHKTIIPKGQKGHWHYTNHLEACFCVQGIGKLTNLSTGEVFDITPNSCYVLDSHDDHTFESIEDIVLISVFNPPVTGMEIHKADGSYEKSTALTELAKKIVATVKSAENDETAIAAVNQLLITKNAVITR